MMAIALSLARRGLGTTSPNPAVGAVIADEETGEVIARGWTQPGGRPHAETEAIRRAGERARGKTIYVTLEPCSHHGKTPPCADAIVEAGLKRAVCGIEDPDPRVSGRGLERLRAAGIIVERRVLAKEAHWITRGHIVRVTERRPFVQLKMALGAEGEVPRGAGGAPVWVTGPAARAHGALLRARSDAILVGRGTVEADDPELTCRLPGLTHRSPIRVILGANGLPPPSSKLILTSDRVPLWLFTCASRAVAAAASGTTGAARLFSVPSVDGRLWLPAVMEALVAEGITRLLVEGGPVLWRAFAGAGFADEIVHYRAAGPAGAALGEAAVFADVRRYAPGPTFTLADRRRIGDDHVSMLRRT